MLGVGFAPIQQPIDETVVAGVEAGFLIDPLANVSRRSASGVPYQGRLAWTHADRCAAQSGFRDEGGFSQ
jgi:hypothetical protein